MQHSTHHEMVGSTFADWVPLLIVGVFAMVYLIFFINLKNKKKDWNWWRSISFVVGICLLGIAIWPSMMKWGHVDMRGHMVQHLLIAMFAPIFLVLGAPLTLALRSLHVKISRGMSALMKTGFFRILSHPVTALFLNIGGMYVLYLTPLYNASFTYPSLHHLIHIHFFAAGYLFTWAMIGPDPAPNKPGLRVRVFVLFLSVAAHAFLSKLMYAYLLPLNSPHSNDQIREGAKLMYYWGDVSELLLAVVLFATWYKNKRQAEYRFFPK